MSSAPWLPRKLVRSVRNLYLHGLDTLDRLSGRCDPMTPPRALHFVGGGDFKAVGLAYLEHFKALGGLAPHHAVLDIGCGTGRMAVPLLDYLDASASYTGFDISRPAISWCSSHISARNQRFRFEHADIYNLEYNAAGTMGADSYRFPCSDDSVDFAFATSVFTHIHSHEVRHYFAELRRVMRPGARALVTFFVVDRADTNPTGSAFGFRHEVRDGYTIDPKTPERAIGYPESWLRTAVADAGLEVQEPIRYGSWSGREDGHDFQDILVIQRIGAGR